MNNMHPNLHIRATRFYSTYTITTNNHQQQQDEDENNIKFKTSTYWNHRFQTEHHYEWLGTFQDFKHALITVGKIDFHLPLEILFVGTGNSSFPDDFLSTMTNPTTCKFCNIDFSSVVIEIQKQRYPSMEWLTMDMTEMTFDKSRKFDIVIDKAAMDALVVDRGDPWYPNEITQISINKMMTCIANVLKPNGRFISIHFEQPIHRKIHFERIFQLDSRWEPHIDVQEIDIGMGYFCSVLKMKGINL